MLKTEELFDTAHTLVKSELDDAVYPFEILPHLKEIITEIQRKLDKNEFAELYSGVFVARDAKMSEKATVIGPAIIGHLTEIRPGAYIRGNVIIGDGVVIGNSTEVKNSIIFDGAQLPHYNYVGDSIIGYKAHMGAGCIASNLRLDKGTVVITDGTKRYDTGLRKIGVMLGDCAEIGCNSVLCPGCMIGKGSLVYPLTCVNGVIPELTVLKRDGTMVRRKDQ